ncbi:MAG: outer membrane protein assembly factor BamD [bacterium]|nr:outer membrane protein assembly factor BamD [bacterium]
MKRLLYLLAILGFFSACGNGVTDDPILRLSAAEAMAEGKALVEKGKYGLAREYFQHAFEVEPNSAMGREALLLVADALFQQGGSQGYLKAEAKYRDFQNRFPTSDRSAYVQFQLARSLEERIRPPDRDQSISRKALEAFEDVIQIFPTSEYAVEARERIKGIRQTLAQSEFMKGRFNQKIRLHQAAASRYEEILEEFPEYLETDKVLFFLIRSLQVLERADEAAEIRKRLTEEHPQSEYLSQLSE